MSKIRQTAVFDSRRQPEALVSTLFYTHRNGRTRERLFREETGVSFGRWRRQIQLARAVRLLAEGNKITAVAMEVGYSSPSAFLVTFRKAFGATPSKCLAG